MLFVPEGGSGCICQALLAGHIASDFWHNGRVLVSFPYKKTTNLKQKQKYIKLQKYGDFINFIFLSNLTLLTLNSARASHEFYKSYVKINPASKELIITA